MYISHISPVIRRIGLTASSSESDEESDSLDVSLESESVSDVPVFFRVFGTEYALGNRRGASRELDAGAMK